MRIPHALILIVQVITFGIISVMLTPLEILKGRSEKDTSTKFFFRACNHLFIPQVFMLKLT